MIDEICDYGRLCELCDEHLAAADLAKGKDARIEHLENAFRFAQKASQTKGGSPDLDREL